jgi:type II secretory pathway pseudopilin PulG
MMKAKANANRKRAQSGYALLMVVFMAALMIIAAAAIQINFLTQGRREKEEELIWRGQQYARGVRLFYRKNGRFPTSLDNLIKPGIGVRYMRKAYKEPMNTVDGSWRLLYVGPAGQIIGSVKANPGGSIFPAAPAPGGAQAGAATAPQGSAGGNAGDATSSGTAPGQAQPPGSPQTANTSSQQPSAFGTDGTIIGGNIIGVASKINQTSIKVYDSGTTYRAWEFIYNPSKDVTTIGQTGVVVGTPNNQAPGANPASGTMPGSPNPLVNPPPQNPPPNPPPQNPQ